MLFSPHFNAHYPPQNTPDLLNVFETFLPQLLAYPNPADPLNGEAAALLMREPDQYKARVRGMCWVLFGVDGVCYIECVRRCGVLVVFGFV